MTTEIKEVLDFESEEREELEQVASMLHGVLGMRLGRFLDTYVDEHNLGHVTNSSTTFEFKNNPPKRQPDVAFISLEKMPEPIDSEIPFAPDLAVEVISRNDDWSEVVSKAKHYLEAGTQLVWIVDPYTQSVFVFRPDQLHQMLTITEELNGENVVPGFKLSIGKLFKQVK